MLSAARKLSTVPAAALRTPLFVTSPAAQVLPSTAASTLQQHASVEEQMALKMALQDQEIDALRAKVASLEMKLSPPRCAARTDQPGPSPQP